MRYNEYDAIKNEREVHFMKRLRILGLILTVLLVSFAFASCGGSENIAPPKDYEEAGGSAGLLYAEKDDGTCAVAGIGECTDTEIVIPTSSPDGLRVSEIGSYAFRGNGSIVSVKIQGSVTAIGDLAFQNCSSLASVSLGENVQTIGNGAFGECAGLKKVEYTGTLADWCGIKFDDSPRFDNVEDFRIGGEPIEGDVVIPEGVTKIGDWGFALFKKITSVSLPNSLVSIGSFAFAGCTSLQRINIPDGVKEIKDYTFNGCSALRYVDLGHGVEKIGYWAFHKCCKGNWGIMPPSESDSAEKWAEYYEWCDKNCGLSEITIPASVKYISSYAFYDCMQLEKVTFENTEGWTTSTDRGLTKTPADVSNPRENAITVRSSLTAYYSWERVSD